MRYIKTKAIAVLIALALLSGCNATIVTSNTSSNDVSSTKTTTIMSDTYTGTLSEPIVINTNKDVSITLKDLTMTTSSTAIEIKKAKSINIIIEGNVSLTNEKTEDGDSVILSDADMTFSGSGTLTINAQTHHCIDGKNITFNDSVTYNLTAATDCIHAKETITINDGNFNLSAYDEAIQSDTIIQINGGIIDGSSEGDLIKAKSLVEINGGSITTQKAVEGIESKDKLIVNDGNINLTTTDDCMNASNSIIINGGTIYAVSNGNDSIDSNGTITINGGTIYAQGLSTPEGAFDCDNSNFEINGGILIGLGVENSQPKSGTQNTIIIQSNEIPKIVTIKDSQSNIVFTYEFPEIENNGMMGGNMNPINGDTNMMPNGDFAIELPNGEQPNMYDENINDMMMPDDGMPFAKEKDDIPNDGEIPQGDGTNLMPPLDEDRRIELPSGFNLENKNNNKNQMENVNGNANNQEFNKGNRDNQGDKMNKFGMSGSSVQIFISISELKTNETYEIYVNDTLLDTITIENILTTIGNVTGMFGGGFGGGMKGNR